MDGQTTVPEAGKPIPIGIPLLCKSVTITALPANTGLVAVGRAPDLYDLADSGTYKSDGPNATTPAGILLSPGESILLEAKVLTDIWLDAAVGGEGAAWSVERPCCAQCAPSPANAFSGIERRCGG